MEKVYRLPVTLLRGGTSKGVYLLEKDLPANRKEWDSLLLRLMGSPDKKQIDGLGGSQSVTSKVAILRKSDRPDADVDYTFAQVSVDKAVVSYGGNCGNISSGVGPFAIEKKLVPALEGRTLVRIYNTNTGKVIQEEVPTSEGQVKYEGDFRIAGVPGTAAPLKLRFVDPAGTLGKGLLPTGNPVDVLEVPGREQWRYPWWMRPIPWCSSKRWIWGSPVRNFRTPSTGIRNCSGCWKPSGAWQR